MTRNYGAFHHKNSLVRKSVQEERELSLAEADFNGLGNPLALASVALGTRFSKTPDGVPTLDGVPAPLKQIVREANAVLSASGSRTINYPGVQSI